MKKKLIEKITKATRNFNTFKGFLSGQNDRVASKAYSRELAGSWSDIKRYLGIAKVSFEFECYLDCADGPFDEGNGYELDLIYLRNLDATINNLRDYFPEWFNETAYSRLETAYHKEVSTMVEDEYDEKLDKARDEFEAEQEDLDEDEREEFDEDDFHEKNFYRIKEDVMGDYTINEFIGEKYRNLLSLVKKFDFESPIYGFYSEDDDYIHRTEESHYSDGIDSSNQNAEEYLTAAYNNIKQRLLEVFGDDTKVYVSSEWHGYSTDFKIKNPDAWFVEYDGSLDKYKDSYDKVPVEVITPHIPIGEAIKVLDTFKQEVFECYYGETDTKRIGCHTNIIFPEAMTLNRAKLIILSDSDFWAKKFKRFDSKYAYSQIESIKRNILRSNPNGIRSTSIKDMEAMISNNINMDKMMSINFLKTNVIEFRFPGNEYFTKYYDELKEVTQWLVYMVTAALIPSFHRQEYIDKLYRFLTTIANDENPHIREFKGAMKLYIGSLIDKNERFGNAGFITGKFFDLIKSKDFKLGNELDKLIEELKPSIKELKLRSTANIKYLVTHYFARTDIDSNSESMKLFYDKIDSIKNKTPLDDKTKLEFENDYAAVMMYNAYRSLLKFITLSGLPLTDV